MFDAIRPREFTEPRNESPKFAFCPFEQRFLRESETRRDMFGRLICGRDATYASRNF